VSPELLPDARIERYRTKFTEGVLLMNNAFLAAMIALGLNPETPSMVSVTHVPMPTPTPVQGTPFVKARVAHANTLGLSGENRSLGTALALGRASDNGVQVFRKVSLAQPLEAGIVGPVYLTSWDGTLPNGRVGPAALVDARQVEE
jgi:hypothetical protein